MFENQPVLSGPRVAIRPFSLADISDVYIGWLRDPVVTRYSNQRFRTHERESSLAFVRSFVGTDNHFLLLTSYAHQRPIGTATVYASRHHGTADVGIMIGDRSVWGQGLGLDAWSLVVDWLLAEPSIRKVTAGTLSCNAAMLRLMERSGFALEATRRAQEIVDGTPVDVLLFARFSDA
jgi:[ribosomal protein S5]-alanine N-acetyltransferase